MTLVLCYHAVSESWQHGLSLAPGTIERQLAALQRRGLRPVGTAEAVRRRRNAFHVTFDDAFRNALPTLELLERGGVLATVFACTGLADRHGARLAVRELAHEPPHELETMRWDELRALVERGHEVASHTVSHPHLTRLADVELDDELRGSRQRLEDELARPCRWLAYPYGEHDARVRAAAVRAGYEASFAVAGRFGRPSQHAIPRVAIYRRHTSRRFGLVTAAPAVAARWTALRG